MAILPLILLVFIATHQVSSLKLPKTFKQCYITDENLNDCLLNAIKDAIPKVEHGMPEFFIPNLNPLVLPRMDIVKGHGPVILRTSFKNLTIHNLFEHSEVLKVNMDVEKKTIEVAFRVAKLSSDGIYETKGRVMVFPVNGHGSFTTTMYETVIGTKIIGKPVVLKSGQTVTKFDEVLITQKPKRMHLYFENVINGDKVLSENFNKFINENWKIVFEEIKPNLSQALITAFKLRFKAFFDAVTFEDLFPAAPTAPPSSETSTTTEAVSTSTMRK